MTSYIETWMRANEQGNLYELGSQPPLLLTFGNSFDRLHPAWNVGGLGWRRVDPALLSRAKILHWTGPSKPWMQYKKRAKQGRPPDAYSSLWQPYRAPRRCITYVRDV